MATNAKYKVFNGTSWEELIFPVRSHTHSEYVPTTRTVNGKALSSNITLSASDVQALPSTTSYVKSASVSGNTLTLTTTGLPVTFTPTFTDTNYYPSRSYSSGLQISTSQGVTDTCKLYVPNAASNQAGVVTTGNQTFAGQKTFNNTVSFKDGIILAYASEPYIYFENYAGSSLVFGFNAASGTELDDDYYVFLPDEDIMNSGGTAYLGLKVYRHAIQITSGQWNTSASVGTTSRTVSFEIYSTNHYKATSLSAVLSLLESIGATTQATATLAKTTTAIKEDGQCVYRNSSTAIVNAYKNSTTDTSFTVYYLTTSASATITDVVSAI
jgi:hypothetical protein